MVMYLAECARKADTQTSEEVLWVDIRNTTWGYLAECGRKAGAQTA